MLSNEGGGEPSGRAKTCPDFAPAGAPIDSLKILRWSILTFRKLTH
jgi:hypothetical protein